MKRVPSVVMLNMKNNEKRHAIAHLLDISMRRLQRKKSHYKEEEEDDREEEDDTSNGAHNERTRGNIKLRNTRGTYSE